MFLTRISSLWKKLWQDPSVKKYFPFVFIMVMVIAIFASTKLALIQQIFNSRAGSDSNVVFKSTSGAPLSVGEDGIPITESLTVQVEVSLPLTTELHTITRKVYAQDMTVSFTSSTSPICCGNSDRYIYRYNSDLGYPEKEQPEAYCNGDYFRTDERYDDWKGYTCDICRANGDTGGNGNTYCYYGWASDKRTPDNGIPYSETTSVPVPTEITQPTQGATPTEILTPTTKPIDPVGGIRFKLANSPNELTTAQIHDFISSPTVVTHTFMQPETSDGLRRLYGVFLYPDGSEKRFAADIRYVNTVTTSPPPNNPGIKATLPSPIIVMDGFSLDPDKYGELRAIYDETRRTINVAADDIEQDIRLGKRTREDAQILIRQFHSEGKIYLERVQSILFDNGQAVLDGNGMKITDPQRVFNSWKPVLDNPEYDGIFINEYTEDLAVDGRSINSIEALRLVREAYPNKIIMAAIVQRVGFSGSENPYSGQVESYKSLLEALDKYADSIFYESYLPEQAPDTNDLSYYERTRKSFREAGVLDKTFYGLYIPQTLETQNDDKGVDNSSEKAIGAHLEKQIELVNQYYRNGEIQGIGFWVYYRTTPHVMKSTNALVRHYFINNQNSRLTQQDENLLKNSSFELYESENQPQNWIAAKQGVSGITRTNYTLTTIPFEKPHFHYGGLIWSQYMNLGTYGMKLTHVNGGTARLVQTVNVSSGATYNLKALFRSISGDKNATLKVVFNNNTSISKSVTLSGDAFPDILKWELGELWFKAPNGSTQATITIESSCGDNTSGFLVDWIQLEQTIYEEQNITQNNNGSCAN